AESTFTGWSGDCTGRAGCTLTLDAPRSVTATFVRGFEIAVVKDGAGGGTVRSTPAGILCGATCSGQFDPGTMVTLVAEPDPTSTFMGWAGSCSGAAPSCTVRLDARKEVRATFAARSNDRYSLTVLRSGSGSGRVATGDRSIDCGETCVATYAAGTQVSLKA